jgi:hypothetical protein
MPSSRPKLSTFYRMWAAIPVFFGIQQAFEGRVWQMLDMANSSAAVPCALGFHFFSHFLWLWWIPLCCYLVEPGKIRKWIAGGCTLFGAFAGTLVYSVMLAHPEWMSVDVREHSICYSFTVPYHSGMHLPISAAALYALTLLVPMFISSHGKIRIFGVLVVVSMILTSKAYSEAYVSVWCFFAAVLSLYLVYMIRHFVRNQNQLPSTIE